MSSTEDCRRIVAELEQKLADAEARVVELEVERRQLSYDALVGNDQASKELARLTKESTTATIEIANAKAAVEEGKRRMNAAIRDEEMAEDREKAVRWLELAERRVERGRRIHAALDAVRKEIEDDKADVDALHVLGCPAPTSQQFRVYGGLALATFLTGLPLKAEREHLAPRERRSFQELAIEQRASVARLAAPFLGEKEAA